MGKLILKINKAMKTNTLKNYKEAIELIQYFTNRVENGTIRSRTTYGKYKDFLNRIKQLEESQPEPAKLPSAEIGKIQDTPEWKELLKPEDVLYSYNWVFPVTMKDDIINAMHEYAKLYHEANSREIDWEKIKPDFIALCDNGNMTYGQLFDWFKSEIEKQTKS
ncbi:MAG TPA: hypothetical protein DF296_13700 [Candidatus Margulisbacteria bacterium]|nr:hypothetical protein [Candidatus Margulisiibacteriota bacterium]